MTEMLRRLGPVLTCCFLISTAGTFQAAWARKYDRQDLILLREEVRQMFEHAYSSYVKYAYPYDELRPLTCDGIDTWGSYSLTLIDALDTLAVMGNYTEFQRVVDIVTANANFDANINVSVFETNIRIVGGLLSAHLLSHRAGVAVEPGWPCNGRLLRLAEDVAQRLLPAFDTPTGMPYGTVNLRHGVPPGETTVTCTAGVGTFILEFATLSRLTGDPIYEQVALNALHSLYAHRSSIGLFGNHIDVMTGRWTAQDSGIGAGVDSFFEYLVKGSVLLGRPELMAMFARIRQPIDKYLRKNNWYVWASMHKGQVTLPVFQSLEAYWPAVLALIGDIDDGLRSMHNYNSVWKQYGFTPEFYNIGEGEAAANRESYPLRPELAESAMYLYRATGDTFMLDIGVNILRSIQHSAKTPCGYATIKDTRDHTQENRMESFFLAETTKYLYLLFDPDNFIHNKGHRGRVHTLHDGRQCVLDAGGYIFNTEAHPIDPGALLCCHDNWQSDNSGEKNMNANEVRGDDGDEMLFPSTKENTINYNNFRGEQLADRHRKRKSRQERRKTDEVVRPPANDTSAVTDNDNNTGETTKRTEDNHQTIGTTTPESEKVCTEKKEGGAPAVVAAAAEEGGSQDKNKMKNYEKLKTHIMGVIKKWEGGEGEGEGLKKDDEPTFRQDYHYRRGGGSSPPPWSDDMDNLSYQIDDDTEEAAAARRGGGAVTPSGSAVVEPPPVFDPQRLLERTKPPQVPSATSYHLLACKAQPFSLRLTIAGQFLDEK